MGSRVVLRDAAGNLVDIGSDEDIVLDEMLLKARDALDYVARQALERALSFEKAWRADVRGLVWKETQEYRRDAESLSVPSYVSMGQARWAQNASSQTSARHAQPTQNVHWMGDDDVPDRHANEDTVIISPVTNA